MEMSVIKDMVLGKPAPLVSTFRLSYYTILNLMSRVEGQFTAEHVIRNSFHQFQYEKALPEIVQKITRLENEATLLDSSGETDLAEYHKLGLDISELEKKIMSEMIRPERALLYLVPGRLVGNSTLHKFCSGLRMRCLCSPPIYLADEKLLEFFLCLCSYAHSFISSMNCCFVSTSGFTNLYNSFALSILHRDRLK